MARPLTSTSYAVLGLLALRDWSAYELTQQVQRSLRNFWPRAESKLYLEPKKLVAHGLATVQVEHQGRRRRQVYSITDQGRAELRGWLDRPGDPPSLEYEALLKVFFADQGTPEQLRAQIATIRAWADEELRSGLGFVREYLESGGPFPERSHVIALVVRLLWVRTEAIRAWAEWAQDAAQSWPDVGDLPRQVFQQILEEAGDVGAE